MRKVVLLGVLGLIVSGCAFTPETAVLKQTIKKAAITVADDTFDDAIFFLCRAAPVGLIMRKFDAEQREAWSILCAQNTQLPNVRN